MQTIGFGRKGEQKCREIEVAIRCAWNPNRIASSSLDEGVNLVFCFGEFQLSVHYCMRFLRELSKAQTIMSILFTSEFSSEEFVARC